MKSLNLLWQQIAVDCGNICCVSTAKDIEYVSSRIEHEGVSFLTITLPSFGADFEKSLSQGYVSPNLFHSFRKGGGKKCGLPAFLQGYTGLVFNPESGVLLDAPSIEAIFCVRQLTGVFKKILLPCSDAREEGAIRKYIECEQEVRDSDRSVSSEMLYDLSRVGALLFRDVFTDLDSDVWRGDLIPKHGPGKTADGLLGNAKYHQTVWTQRLERSFPFGEFCVPNPSHSLSMHGSADFLEPGQELPVKVVTVPKTLKTPRIIAIEPTCMQYAQQSLMQRFVELLEGPWLFRGMIGFTSQEFNHSMACAGSVDGSLATLDLSEASDRVSNQHVLALLSNWRNLSEAVQDCRSRKAGVPGYGVKRLAKFASMGSALCFPFEAMIFLTIVFIGIGKELKTPVNRRMIHSFLGQVRIYGDDIIIPSRFATSVAESLESYGYRVNHDKSFWTGLFRESCGKEYYAGFDVSSVKVRRVFPTTTRDASETISLVSLRNQFYRSGLWGTVRYLDNIIESLLRFYPVVQDTSPVLGRHSFLESYDLDGMDAQTHSPVVKGYVLKSSPPVSLTSGEGALLKFFLNRQRDFDHMSFLDLPSMEEEHLERYGRPKTVRIKLRMASPV